MPVVLRFLCACLALTALAGCESMRSWTPTFAKLDAFFAA